jgi:predicted ATP-binding protein involved in virulence
MVKIKELRLQHFRAFTNARFVLDDQLTVVIGRNGSGKSTLMDAFDVTVQTYGKNLFWRLLFVLGGVPRRPKTGLIFRNFE